MTRRTRILLIVAGIVVLLLLGGSRLLKLYVDWLWFGEVGFRSVFSTKLFTNVLLFLIGGLLIGGLSALSLWIAYRSRPVFVPVTGPEDPIARYRTLIIQRLRLFAVGIPVIIGVIAGFASQGNWQIVQLFLNSTPFGTTDPVFNIDISFYTFQLPFYRFLLGWLFAAVALGFVLALITHYIFGGIRLTGRAGQVSAAARAQLAILAGVFVLLKAVAYFFDRYELLFSDRGQIFDGASYTDLNAVMPAKLILLFISVICAIAFFAAVFRRNLQLPAIATVLLVLSSVLIGAAWPAVLQQFVVAPNANVREAPQIQRNIDATRAAFGLGPDKVNSVQFSGTSTATSAAVRNDTATVPNIRLLDPAKVSDTFNQLRQTKAFYAFPSKLDIDRYTAPENGVQKTQDYLVAARELNPSGLTGNQTSWINRHLVFTHGNGLVVAPANQVNATLEDAAGTGGQSGQSGLPLFTSIDTGADQSKIPETFRIPQPRVYYSEMLDSDGTGYSIVGAPQGSTPREYDSDSENSTYTGSGGVPLGNVVNRLAFSLLYGEQNILFNNSINADSKIMYVRDPKQRVEQVAPWLTTDSDPYPAVVGGKLTWIVDGYTTLSNYPYSQSMSLGEATADAQQGLNRQSDQQISYLRNSVKATVDAYDGTVKLYAFDETDPVLKTWMKAFPGTVQPASAITPDLKAHLRYPEDQFKVQRELLSKYHVDDPNEFYGGSSFWGVPSDPTAPPGTGTSSAQPPYYVLAGEPGAQGQATPSFQITSALVFNGRENLAAYVSASSDPDSYGKITVLELPQTPQTKGPQQVQTAFLGATSVSSDISLFNRGGQSTVQYGNLLTLPVAGGLLFVEPIYLERTGQDSSSYPQLARVLLYFGDRIGYGASLNIALDQLFGKGAGDGATVTPGQTTTPPPGGTGAPPPGGTVSQAAATAATAIETALTQLKAAQTSGDFAAQGAALAALDKAAQQFKAAQGGTGG